MMRRVSAGFARLSAALLSSACMSDLSVGQSEIVASDGGAIDDDDDLEPTPRPDAGGRDAGAAPPADAGRPPRDAGAPPPRDAGEPPRDASPPPRDAAAPPRDAGPPDASTCDEDDPLLCEPDLDAGLPVECGPDDCVPPLRVPKGMCGDDDLPGCFSDGRGGCTFRCPGPSIFLTPTDAAMPADRSAPDGGADAGDAAVSVADAGRDAGMDAGRR